MKTYRILTLVLTILLPASAHAIDKKMIRQIERLAPRDQLEQRCDTEGMARVSGDKVIAYTFADPKYSRTRIEAPGAVFRRKGEWYHLAYRCTTTEDHITVKSFKYKIGDLIPRSQWKKYYLYD